MHKFKHHLGCAVTTIAAWVFASPLHAASLDTSADAVLGQPNFSSVDPNQPAFNPTASNLALSNAAHLALSPTGRIYVSDPDNNRVLSWPNAANFTNGEAADMVIGQPTFMQGAPNRGNSGAVADGFFLPQGVHVSSNGDLWVADAFNNRVLRFDDPVVHDGIADLVIGQRDFNSNGANLGLGDDGAENALPDSLLFPGRVLTDANGVWISDSGNSRVLYYTHPQSNKPFAEFVLGQYGDLSRRAKNNDGSGNSFGPPSADNLFNCIGIALDGYDNLYVADWQNHRVLRYDDPMHTDMTADAVFGQPDFTSATFDNGGLTVGLQLPIDVFVDLDGALYIADSNNHRVLVHRDPLFDQLIADDVLGQLDAFTTDDVNHGLGPFTSDADALHGPTAIAVDADRNVFVTDANSSRSLRYDTIRDATARTDFDLDGDVDAVDARRMIDCMTGPDAGEVTASCLPADIDRDVDVDLADIARLQRCYGGSGVPVDAFCAD